MEVGIRQDSGDTETGFGLDLGAGIVWKVQSGASAVRCGDAPSSPTQMRISRTRAWPSPAHGSPAQPSPAQPTLGRPSRCGTPWAPQQLVAWMPCSIPSPWNFRVLSPAAGSSLKRSWPMAWPSSMTASPSSRPWVALSPDGAHYSLLWALQPYSRQGQADVWQLSLDVHRQEESSATSPVDHSLKLGFSLSL